ncbi:hypothetical protein F5883DRAFT_210792 [Diaporthe sp. PMI_573]|nr:hypothetical protein F5883DRAFT_210792 [Diaporthaceae sp. PMI_573]
MSDRGSGSTTNPNTPRSPEGVSQGEILQPQEVDGDNSSFKTTTTSSSGSDHDLHPSWPTSFDVADVPAMATWGPSDQPLGDMSLGNLWFGLHWDLQSHVAFFTLRTSVKIPRKKTRGRGRGRRAVFYIFIYPERIRELSLDTNPNTQPFGAKSLLLRFVLDRPPALVMPMTFDDNDENAKGLMDSCHRLASQTSFQLHVDMYGKRLTVKQLQQLCVAACGTGLSSSKRHARTDTLYHGEGGRVIEGETMEPPPLYNEPTAVISSAKGKKRRRLDSPSPESFTSDSTAPPSLKAMRALFDNSLASFKQELKQELRQELKQDFDDSLAAHKTQVADTLAAHKQDVALKLQQTEARIVSTVRNEFGDHWNNMEQSMMDTVREEMGEAQEEIMQNITEQQLTATLTFTNHPIF